MSRNYTSQIGQLNTYVDTLEENITSYKAEREKLYFLTYLESKSLAIKTLNSTFQKPK